MISRKAIVSAAARPLLAGRWAASATDMRGFGGEGLADAFALGALALELAGAADGCGAFAGALLRRLFVMTAQLHLAVNALALQLLLERAQRLLDIIVANDDLHKSPSQTFQEIASGLRGIPRRLRALSSASPSVQPVAGAV